jgi:hypothetical protein
MHTLFGHGKEVVNFKSYLLRLVFLDEMTAIGNGIDYYRLPQILLQPLCCLKG